MKIIQSLILFTLTLIVPCTALYLATSQSYLGITLSIYVLGWSIVFHYLDKILLMILSAREVIDTDEQLFFQRLKSKSYKEQQPIPMVYLYSGRQPNCFILESFRGWAIVIERDLLLRLKNEELEELINYLYKFKRQNNVWLLTKSLGLSVIVYRFIYFFLENILFLKRSSYGFKILSVFLILLFRPLIYPFERLNTLYSGIEADKSLRALTQEVDDIKSISFLRLLFGNLDSDVQLRKILIYYLEGFSIFRKVKFNEEQF